MRHRNNLLMKYSIAVIITSIVCWLFPYTGDDWAWGSRIGLERLSTWFHDYNGRYVGNLIVLALTRSRLLRAVAMGITLMGIVYCTERLTRRRWSFMIAVLSLLCLPVMVMRQAVVWTSGFSNYATSAFSTMVFFVYLNEHPITGRKEKNPASTIVLLMILGLCNTLIVENLTIYHVLMSVSLVLYGLLKYRILRKDLAAYALSCIAGMGIMFSNSSYRLVLANTEGQNEIAKGGLGFRILENYFGVIYHDGYFNNAFLNILIFAACLILTARFLKRKPGRLQAAAAVICIVVMAVFLGVSIVRCAGQGFEYEEFLIEEKEYFEGILTLANLIATILLSLLTTYDGKIHQRLLLLWAAAVMMIAPLFIVNPIGSRCFFCSYAVLTLIACELFKCIPRRKGRERIRGAFLTAAGVLIVFGILYHSYFFVKIYRADLQRTQSVRAQMAAGQERIEIHHLPYEQRLWMGTPENEAWMYRYKVFYGIPEETEVVVME